MSDRRFPEMGDHQVESLGKTVLGILAIGLSAGLGLIAGANMLGQRMTEKRREAHPNRDDENE